MYNSNAEDIVSLGKPLLKHSLDVSEQIALNPSISKIGGYAVSIKLHCIICNIQFLYLNYFN